jgi:protein PhnA
MQETKCPECESEHTYEDGAMTICALCAHEWATGEVREIEGGDVVIKDSNGAVLANGDTVMVIKDLKIKGSPNSVKMGTKVKNIRLVSEGDHNIDCKIDGIGAMSLKSEFVKKV